MNKADARIKAKREVLVGRRAAERCSKGGKIVLVDINVLNIPGIPFECEGRIGEACFAVGKLGLTADDLEIMRIKGSRDPKSALGSPNIYARVRLYSKEEIPEKFRRKLGQAIAAVIKRTPGARHCPVRVIVLCPEPAQVTICRRK
jgi:hypothetical protein